MLWTQKLSEFGGLLCLLHIVVWFYLGAGLGPVMLVAHQILCRNRSPVFHMRANVILSALHSTDLSHDVWVSRLFHQVVDCEDGWSFAHWTTGEAFLSRITSASGKKENSPNTLLMTEKRTWLSPTTRHQEQRHRNNSSHEEDPVLFSLVQCATSARLRSQKVLKPHTFLDSRGRSAIKKSCDTTHSLLRHANMEDGVENAVWRVPGPLDLWLPPSSVCRFNISSRTRWNRTDLVTASRHVVLAVFQEIVVSWGLDPITHARKARCLAHVVPILNECCHCQEWAGGGAEAWKLRRALARCLRGNLFEFWASCSNYVSPGLQSPARVL